LYRPEHRERALSPVVVDTTDACHICLIISGGCRHGHGEPPPL